jgi:hypothetical protein
MLWYKLAYVDLKGYQNEKGGRQVTGFYDNSRDWLCIWNFT